MTLTDTMAYDPDVAVFLRAVEAAERPRFEQLDVPAARAFYRAARKTVGLAPVAIGEVIEDSIAGRTGSIAIRRYLPQDLRIGRQPAILFFHGGGWVVGDLDTHDGICRYMVRASGLQVIAIDYRLAPEHRFPAAVEDAMDAHVMLIEHGAAWGIDPDRIVLMGDSAGGALAIVVGLHARDMCLPLPAAQLLFYPVTDLRGGSDSYRDVGGVPITAATMRWFSERYLSAPADAADWRTSPLLAESLASLPPTFLAVAEKDPLYDEGLALGARLYRSGVTVELRDLPGMVHGFLTLGRVIGEAKRSLDAAASFLRRTIG